MTFHTFTTFDPWKSLISQRLYVSELDENTLKQTVLYRKGIPGEKKGLGMTQYFPFAGRILKLLGIALMTKNEKGETIYVNKSSFSHYILRLKKATRSESVRRRNDVETRINNISISQVNKIYEKNEIPREKINDQNQITDSNWNSEKNIQQLIRSYLKI